MSNCSVMSSHLVSRIIEVEKMHNYNFQVQIPIVGCLHSYSCPLSKYRFRWQLAFNFEKLSDFQAQRLKGGNFDKHLKHVKA